MKLNVALIRNNSGFTLVELLLAMAIFSFVLAGMAQGVIRLIHFYQATIDIRATQEVARQISDDIILAARSSALVTQNSSTNTGGTYGSQTESSICFFNNITAHNPDGSVTGDGTGFRTQNAGGNKWDVYQVHFSGYTSSLAADACKNLSGGTKITPGSVSFIRFEASTSPDNRLLNLYMGIAGSNELTPGTNINYGDHPPDCKGGEFNNYCSITNLQIAAEVRLAQS